MTAIVLGLTAALAYGFSDFVAGILSRRIHYSLVALIGNGVACVATILALIVTAAPNPSNQALFWGAASGIGSGLGRCTKRSPGARRWAWCSRGLRWS